MHYNIIINESKLQKLGKKEKDFALIVTGNRN